MHECPEAQEVWQAVAAAWKEVTQEALDVSTPRLTVMGLRVTAGGGLGSTGASQSGVEQRA